MTNLLPLPDVLAQTLARAASAHQSGDLVTAEQGYREILAAAPNSPEALHGLGILAIQCGHFEAGMALLDSAAAAAPNSPMPQIMRGSFLQQRGDFAQAAEAFGIAYRIDRQDDTASSLTRNLLAVGRVDEAVAPRYSEWVAP